MSFHTVRTQDDEYVRTEKQGSRCATSIHSPGSPQCDTLLSWPQVDALLKVQRWVQQFIIHKCGHSFSSTHFEQFINLYIIRTNNYDSGPKTVSPRFSLVRSCWRKTIGDNVTIESVATMNKPTSRISIPSSKEDDSIILLILWSYKNTRFSNCPLRSLSMMLWHKRHPLTQAISQLAFPTTWLFNRSFFFTLLPDFLQ